MMKITVLYGNPTSIEDFEEYYESTHLPIAGKMKGVERLELTRFTSAPNGEKPPYYRMAELYFETKEQMEQTMGSEEGKAAVKDIENFATGGATVLIGTI